MKMFLAMFASLLLAMAAIPAKADQHPLEVYTTIMVNGGPVASPLLPSDLREARRGMEILEAYDVAQEAWTACLAAEHQLHEAQQNFDAALAAVATVEIDDLDFTAMNEALVAVRSAQTERDSVCQQVVEPTERFEVLVADWNEVQEERHQATVELQNQVEATAELAADNDTKIGMILVDLRRLETELSELRRIDAVTSAWCGIPGNSHTRLCRARDEGH